jgi:hypothetical protein
VVRQISESDWKLFRRLHRVALERFCHRVIKEIRFTTSGSEEKYHERFLEVFALVQKRNKELARTFDDIRRSNAFILLANMKEAGLLTEEEIMEFSQETQEVVQVIIQVRSS